MIMNISALNHKKCKIQDEISKKERILTLEHQSSRFYRRAAASLWNYRSDGIFLSSKTPTERFYMKEIFRLKCSLIFTNVLIAFEKIKSR